MKAWHDLEQEVSLYWTGDRRDPESYWYMDHGCKIEKFKDGKIKIHNAMLAGDHYSEITDEQYEVFENRGWLAGCYIVCIDTYANRIMRASKLLRSNPDDQDTINRLEILRKKLSRYAELNNKLC